MNHLHASRPNGAPAYYQGRPASLWISAMKPRLRSSAAGRQPEPRGLGPRQAAPPRVPINRACRAVSAAGPCPSLTLAASQAASSAAAG
jgi:hypothetical protein